MDFLKSPVRIDDTSMKMGSGILADNKYNVQNNRLSGNHGDYAVSAGTALQPAQSGNSNYADDPHFADGYSTDDGSYYTGDYDDSGY